MGVRGHRCLLAGQKETAILAKSDSAPKRDNEQHKRFVETARELGCDENEAAFEERIRCG